MRTENRPAAKRFEDLLIWQEAHRVVLRIYRITNDFPADERFGLTSQLRRAAASITANIAEGFQRVPQKEKARFLNIAQGSLEETRNFLILARDLGYVDPSRTPKGLEQLGRMLNAYRRAILRTHDS